MLCLADCMLAALVFWCLFTMYSRYCCRPGSLFVICRDSCYVLIALIVTALVFSLVVNLNQRSKCFWKPSLILNVAEGFQSLCMLCVHAWHISYCCSWYYFCFERKKEGKMQSADNCSNWNQFVYRCRLSLQWLIRLDMWNV